MIGSLTRALARMPYRTQSLMQRRHQQCRSVLALRATMGATPAHALLSVEYLYLLLCFR